MKGDYQELRGKLDRERGRTKEENPFLDQDRANESQKLDDGKGEKRGEKIADFIIRARSRSLYKIMYTRWSKTYSDLTAKIFQPGNGRTENFGALGTNVKLVSKTAAAGTPLLGSDGRSAEEAERQRDQRARPIQSKAGKTPRNEEPRGNR